MMIIIVDRRPMAPATVPARPTEHGGDVGLHEGKVALVTGAGRGVGRAEAIALARAGASVVVNDRGPALDGAGGNAGIAEEVVAEIRGSGGRAVANGGDVGDWGEAAMMVEQALDEFGRLDTVICNAGIIRDRMFVNLTPEDWEAVVRVHLGGNAAVSHAACRHWRSEAKAGGATGGSLLLTSSQAAIYGNAGQANYASAKAGIIGLGLTLAREMARYGARVNVVCPRARTRMTESTFGEIAEQSGLDPWDPTHVGEAVAAITSEAFGDVSGQVFVIGAGELRLLEGWTVSVLMKQEAAWNADDVVSLWRDAVGPRDLGVPPMPVEKPGSGGAP
jgi:NAD(P)-dependent dehydrogenase (short-subunit alcohol dehydrogenase family)